MVYNILFKAITIVSTIALFIVYLWNKNCEQIILILPSEVRDILKKDGQYIWNSFIITSIILYIGFQISKSLLYTIRSLISISAILCIFITFILQDLKYFEYPKSAFLIGLYIIFTIASLFSFNHDNLYWIIGSILVFTLSRGILNIRGGPIWWKRVSVESEWYSRNDQYSTYYKPREKEKGGKEPCESEKFKVVFPDGRRYDINDRKVRFIVDYLKETKCKIVRDNKDD